MENIKGDKVSRVLSIYTKLMNGYLIKKSEEAQNYGVNERSIQRDIDDIRDYLKNDINNNGVINSVIYDRIRKGYYLEQTCKMNLTDAEVLAVCKILLDSRAFTKPEMTEIIDKLLVCCVPDNNRKSITELIRSETFYYVELQHKTKFIDTMWSIGQAIRECRYIEINYLRTTDKKIVTRKIKPLAIMFSEYYFYLTAFIEDKEIRERFDVLNDSSPTIYRIDRIKKLKVLDEKFHIPYNSKFEEGEFRKRIQFMYGGKMERIKFNYYGTDVTTVLDKLPTAQIISENDGVYTIQAEVFGKGIDMWIRSQGDYMEVLER